MKKTTLIAVPVLAMALMSGLAMAHSGGVYTALKTPDTSFSIDGKLNDAGWKTAAVGTIGEAVPEWQMNKTQLSAFEAPKDAADCSAQFKVAYNDTFLFFGIDVKDDIYFNEGKTTAWQWDTVEVWLDGQGLGNGKHLSGNDAEFKVAAKLADGQPGISVARMDTGKDAWKEDNIKLKPGVTIASTSSATGYIIEAAIPWTVLEPWIGKHAMSMGIDVQINDNDTGKDAKGAGIRQTEMIWSGGKDMNYADTKLFGDLILQ